jgi:hypothetical protein
MRPEDGYLSVELFFKPHPFLEESDLKVNCMVIVAPFSTSMMVIVLINSFSG